MGNQNSSHSTDVSGPGSIYHRVAPQVSTTAPATSHVPSVPTQTQGEISGNYNEKWVIFGIIFIALGFWLYVYVASCSDMKHQRLETFDGRTGTQRVETFDNKNNPLSSLAAMGSSANTAQSIAEGQKTGSQLHEILDKLSSLDRNPKKSNSSTPPTQPTSTPQDSALTAPTPASPPVQAKPLKCQYIPSYTDGLVCPDGMVHSGAMMSSKNGDMKCNGRTLRSTPAKAYAEIKDGKLHKITLLHKGNNYVEAPRIKIIGDGKSAKAKCILDEDGTIKRIKIINCGYGYSNTPKIKIGKPNGYMHCHLCCHE